MEDSDFTIKIPMLIGKRIKEKGLDIEKLVEHALEQAIADISLTDGYKELPSSQILKRQKIKAIDIPPGSFIQIPNLKLEEFEAIVEEDHWEYLHGKLFHHSPESDHHNAIFVYLLHSGTKNLDPSRYIMRVSRIALQIELDKPEPDVMIFDRNDFRKAMRADGSESDIVESAPLIIIEIVSNSSKDRDKLKEELYYHKGVKEYWQIFAQDPQIHATLCFLKGNKYLKKEYTRGEIRSLIIPDFAISLEELQDPDTGRIKLFE